MSARRRTPCATSTKRLSIWRAPASRSGPETRSSTGTGRHASDALREARMLLNDKVALITGASRGIGAEIAKQLSAEGARIFLAANDSEEALSGVAQQCRQQSSAADVT